MVRLSTPVSSSPNHPPFRMLKFSKDHVAAVLQRDGFVGDAGLRRVVKRVVAALLILHPAAEREALTPDQPRSADSDIVQILAPDQRVMPVVMTVVLIRVVTAAAWFRSVIHSAQLAGGFARQWGCSGLKHGTRREKKMNVALQPDRETKIRPRWEHHRFRRLPPQPHRSPRSPPEYRVAYQSQSRRTNARRIASARPWAPMPERAHPTTEARPNPAKKV